MVYTIVSPDRSCTPDDARFDFSSPVGLVFDEFAWHAGQPRLFVLDRHRVIQVDLDPNSIPDPRQQVCADFQNIYSDHAHS